MKLPKRDEKFVVSRTYEGEECSFYGVVVSGVHIEIWGDDNKPDFIWYYVCADKVDDRFLFGRCLHVALCLEHALDFIARYLIPYQEQEEKPDGEPASETADSSDEGIISERDGGNELSGSMPDDLPCEDCHQSFCSGSAAPSSDDIPLGCMRMSLPKSLKLTGYIASRLWMRTAVPCMTMIVYLCAIVKREVPQMTIRQCFDRFIADRMVYCADKTIRTYTMHLGLFLRWLSDTYGPIDQTDLGQLPPSDNIDSRNL